MNKFVEIIQAINEAAATLEKTTERSFWRLSCADRFEIKATELKVEKIYIELLKINVTGEYILFDTGRYRTRFRRNDENLHKTVFLY